MISLQTHVLHAIDIIYIYIPVNNDKLQLSIPHFKITIIIIIENRTGFTRENIICFQSKRNLYKYERIEFY